MLYPLTDSSHISLLVDPLRTYSFMPQLPEQLSSAIQPGLATLVNGIQCPLRDKILFDLRQKWCVTSVKSNKKKSNKKKTTRKLLSVELLEFHLIKPNIG